MIANLAGGDGLIVLMVALVVLVGGSQLPKIARNVGLAGKEFRKAQAEAEEHHAEQALNTAATAEAAVTPAASPTPGGVTQVSTAPATADVPRPAVASGDSITLTPAQLDSLLKAREGQARTEPTAN